MRGPWRERVRIPAAGSREAIEGAPAICRKGMKRPLGNE